jgi:hypothetical protein
MNKRRSSRPKFDLVINFQAANALSLTVPPQRACLSPSSANKVDRTRLRRLRLREGDAGVEASGPHDLAVRDNIVRLRAVDWSRS